MAREPLTVSVCRGCCCGSTLKHPDIAHDDDLAHLSAAVIESGIGVVRVVKCLDECERSNVIQVRRRLPTGTESIWLGPVNDAPSLNALANWLRTGANAPLPDALTGLVFAKRQPRPPIAIRFARGEEESTVCPVSRPAVGPDPGAPNTTAYRP